jgi:hypothetical protein
MSSESDVSVEDVAAAEARRQRTFRRWIAGVALCVLALIGVRLWWGLVAGRRLQAEIDRYHAAGEPILVADYSPPPDVPDEQNAALLYSQAWTALVRDLDTALAFDDAISYRLACEVYPDDVRKIVRANAEALKLMRQARDLPNADWGVRFTSPLIHFLLPPLSQQRELGKFARTAALFRHQDGDHAEAIETLLDIHALTAKMAERQISVLITHLVVIAIESVAVVALEEMTPTLMTLEARIDGRPDDRPTTCGQIRALMLMLLDETIIRSSWRNAMHLERASQLDTALMLIEGKLSFTGTGPGPTLVTSAGKAVRPMLELEALRMMHYTTQVCEAGLAPNWSKAQDVARGGDLRVSKNAIEKLSHFLSNTIVPSFERAVTLHFRTLAMRRMAAVALAIRLYELDYRHRPASLNLLVPDYLGALPEDPFADDGRTFGYSPEATTPLLYSVNSDGHDDGGEFAFKKEDSLDLDQKDLPYFLNGDRPAPPLPDLPVPESSSLEAVEDDSQEGSDEGDAHQGQEPSDAPEND